MVGDIDIDEDNHFTIDDINNALGDILQQGSCLFIRENRVCERRNTTQAYRMDVREKPI